MRTTINEATLFLVGLLVFHSAQVASLALLPQFRLLFLVVGFSAMFVACLKLWFLLPRNSFLPLFPIFIYFGCLAALSYLQNHEVFASVLSLAFHGIALCFFIFGYTFAQYRFTRELNPRKLFVFFSVGGILLLFGYFSFAEKAAFYGTTRNFNFASINPVGLAYTSCIVSIILLNLFFLHRNKIQKILILLGAIGFFLLVLSTASRGAFLWGCTAICFTVLLHQRKINIAKSFSYLFGFFVTVGLILYFVSQLNPILGERFDIFFGRMDLLFAGAGTIDASLVEREMIVISYLKSWKQWWLAGVRGYSGYPHNQFLEIFVRFGIFGLPLFCLSLFCISKALILGLFRRYLLSDFDKIVLSVFVFCFLQSLTSLSLELNRMLIFGYGYIGFKVFKRPNLNAIVSPQ